MKENLKILGKLSREDAEKFIHKAIDEICDKEGLCYEGFTKLMSLSEYSKLRVSLRSVIAQLARVEIRKQEVVDQLKSSDLSADLCQLICECICVRKEELRSQLVKTSCAICYSHLEDFDWTVKLVLSSDKLGSVQKPVLMLDLELDENGDRKKESLELSKEELASLITSMEAANKEIEEEEEPEFVADGEIEESDVSDIEDFDAVSSEYESEEEREEEQVVAIGTKRGRDRRGRVEIEYETELEPATKLRAS